MSRELLRQAYEGLDEHWISCNPEIVREIEAELAKPDPEPVADMKRLSDDEILKLKNHSMFVSSALSFARAIESALLEKNK